MRTNTRTFPAAEITLESDVTELDLRSIFQREAPLEVDLGCGDGAFLTQLARAHPERDFLGVERLIGRIRGTARRIGDAALPNARILQADILHVTQRLLPPASADVCYLMFPDPWPKRRHASRRTFSASFLAAVHRVLKRDGVLHVATDDAPYFGVMQRTTEDAHHLFTAVRNDEVELPRTTFENRFVTRGLPVHRMSLRKL